MDLIVIDPAAPELATAPLLHPPAQLLAVMPTSCHPEVMGGPTTTHVTA